MVPRLAAPHGRGTCHLDLTHLPLQIPLARAQRSTFPWSHKDKFVFAGIGQSEVFVVRKNSAQSLLYVVTSVSIWSAAVQAASILDAPCAAPDICFNTFKSVINADTIPTLFDNVQSASSKTSAAPIDAKPRALCS